MNSLQLIPVTLPLLKEGDNLVEIICAHADIQDGDILVVSSKVVAITEGATIDLESLEISAEAEEWVKTLNRTQPDGAFRQAVLNETERLHGSVRGECEGAMLCELKPDGLEEGTILAANAGLDKSNIEEGKAIGWPVDPLRSVESLRAELQLETGHAFGVLITDSCCRPRRIGVTAIALTVAGFAPLKSHIGKPDLFGKELHMTNEAVADQLATAANFLMGNADESTPIVLIRNHGIELNDFSGWVPGIEPEEDLFRGMM